MLVHEFLEQSAKAFPEKAAVIKSGQRLTFRELDERANRLAHGLKHAGVRRGDRVGLYLGNSLDAVISIFAVLKADAVFVPANRGFKAGKLFSVLENCQASALITDGRALSQGVAEQVLERVKSTQCVVISGAQAGSRANGHGRVLDFDAIQKNHPATKPLSENIDLDLACLIYTSGTTGDSKGVMCDHGNMVFVTNAVTGYLKNSERDITMNVLPLAFSYGLYQLLAMCCKGGTLVLEDSFAFPDLVLETIARERVTGFAAVPTMYALLLGMDTSRYDLSALRYFTNAAAGLPVEHVRQLRQRFPQVALYLMHGLTEVGRSMYLPPGQTDTRPASSGIPLPGTELWIEGEDGRRVPRGEIGELMVRGRNVMRGYWQAPELSEERFRPGAIPGERICRTGDLFRQDEDGYFYFVSRKDDIIKSRGEKVAPREIENVLYSLAGVREAAVIGVPDALFGQAVKAFIVAQGKSLTENEVISHCKARLEDFMVPRQVEFRSELPKTSSGKIRRVDLR
ncbi:MAG TPA: AMP-binding protein [Verrucomicrobiae bacterium]|nr:AMP-binding protein [Verrucomicrobiae bacterium]